MKPQTSELLGEAEALLEGIFRNLDLQMHFECNLENGVVYVELTGEDSELILADNARLLYAINHLLNQIYFRRTQQGCNFLVDCKDYRSSRALELQLLACKAAERVVASGRELELQAMPASERRIIHLALSEEAGVQTESEGGGPHRRVVIQPAP